MKQAEPVFPTTPTSWVDHRVGKKPQLASQTSVLNALLSEKLLKESIDSDGPLIVSGIIQRANAKNHNGRVYPKEILAPQIDLYTENFINTRNSMGELDHPDSSIVNLKNVSHVINKIWWEGDDVMADIEILNTPSGQILTELFKKKINVGISSRAMGSVKQVNENTVEVEDDLDLVCWDFVSTPSTQGAHMSPLHEGKLETKFDKYFHINSLITNILINHS